MGSLNPFLNYIYLSLLILIRLNFVNSDPILNQVGSSVDHLSSFQNEPKFELLEGFPALLRRGEKLLQQDETDVFFAGVSQQCRQHNLLWVKELTSWLTKTKFDAHPNFDLGQDGTSPRLKFPDTWALQMVDAWGKFPAGVLSGNTQILGDFPECLHIRAKNRSDASEKVLFKGKYCLTVLVPSGNLTAALESQANFNTREAVSLEDFIWFMLTQDGFPLVGTCFPSSCSTEDVTNLFTNFYNTLLGGLFEQIVLDCHTDDKLPMDSAAIVMIVVLGLIASLCILGTIVDTLVYQKSSAESQKRAGKGLKAIVAFSIPTNTRKLFNTGTGSGDLGCIHGLRFLSICWVVYCHSFEFLTVVWNVIDGKKIGQINWTKYFLLNGSVSVDTFFVLSGTLVAYTMLRLLDTTSGRFNIPLLYFHRFCRLTPMYIIVVGFMATLFGFLGSGPFWSGHDQRCREDWWKNLLYITNLETGQFGEKMCLGQSWYISMDMQFYLLSPFIIYPLWRSRNIGLGIIAVLAVATMVTPTVISAVKEYVPTDSPYDIYFRPWARMSVYLTGMVLGYVMYRQKSDHNPLKLKRMPKWAVALCWVISTGLACIVLFSNIDYFELDHKDTEFAKVYGYIFLGFNRTVWGIVISWIIFACINGYGGWVNDILSWSAFIPLGRITFAVYIVSIPIQLILYKTAYTPMAFTVYNTVNYFFAHMVMSCLISYILTVTIESPFLQLEKIFFPEQRKRLEPKPKTAEAVS